MENVKHLPLNLEELLQFQKWKVDDTACAFSILF